MTQNFIALVRVIEAVKSEIRALCENKTISGRECDERMNVLIDDEHNAIMALIAYCPKTQEEFVTKLRLIITEMERDARDGSVRRPRLWLSLPRDTTAVFGRPKKVSATGKRQLRKAA